MPFAGDNNRPPGCSHSRINHNQVYRSVREVRVRLSNGERAIQHVESLDGMADVHNLDPRNDIENHSFDRSHEMIIETKVGGERNDRSEERRVGTEGGWEWRRC